MAVLLYKPCACIKRGDAFRPGTVGHLYVKNGTKVTFVRSCRKCRRKDERLQNA